MAFPCPVSFVPLDVPAGEASRLCHGFGMCSIVFRARQAQALADEPEQAVAIAREVLPLGRLAGA